MRYTVKFLPYYSRWAVLDSGEPWKYYLTELAAQAVADGMNERQIENERD